MKEKKKSVSDGLEFFKEKIIEFSVQGSPNHRSDMDLVKFMHDIVAGLEWARIAKTRCAASDIPWNIQNFFSTLDTAWLNYEKQDREKRNYSSDQAMFKMKLWHWYFGINRSCMGGLEIQDHPLLPCSLLESFVSNIILAGAATGVSQINV